MSETIFGILIIGDEILSGRRKDKHLEKVIDIFNQRDLELSWARYASDDEEMLVQHFTEVKNLGHHCFSFGGIGATVDDLTRPSVARAYQQELIRHPDAVREIEQQFGEKAYPNRILMAEMPADSEIIPNPVNRVPGFSVGTLHCLPGFPKMAWPMMEWVLDNKYQHLESSKSVLETIILKDVHESELIGLLETFQHKYPLVKVSSLPTLPKDGHFQIELGVRGKPEDVEVASKALNSALFQHGFLSG